MKVIVWTVFSLLYLSQYVHGACQSSNSSLPWPSQPPSGCPFPQSDLLKGIEFLTEYAVYPETGADTWYPSWSNDGSLYSCFTDGSVTDSDSGVKISCVSGGGDKANTGSAIIEGDDPCELHVHPLPCQPATAAPYGGRYPSANLYHKGVWYIGTYCLDNLNDYCGNWCTMGPFTGFRFSTDDGGHWNATTLDCSDNLFGEVLYNSVKMGAPHMVDFGKDLEYSPDGKAYMVGTGCEHEMPEANCSWISGDSVYLARLSLDPAAPSTINDVKSWEFFAGRDSSGQPLWSNSFSDIKPLFVWNGRTGVVTMTWNPVLKRYLMVVTTPHEMPYTIHEFDTYVLESEDIVGPFKLVSYMQSFGKQGYFVHFPSRFIADDGVHAWLMYSADFTQNMDILPPGGRYGICMARLELKT